MNQGKYSPPSTAYRPCFLTVLELAELLRVKPRTVYEMVAQKKIPFRKAGRRTLFLLEDVLQWTEPSPKP